MPADLTPLDSDRGDIANLFGFATGFGTRVKNFMTRCFGVDNPFGDAATRNAVTTRTHNAVPVLDSDGNITANQLPVAVFEALGAVAIGGATSSGQLAHGGGNYFYGITPASAREIIEPFADNIISDNIEIADLALRNYGPSGALRTAFVIPRFACFVLISANGGVSGIRQFTGRRRGTIIGPGGQPGIPIRILEGDGSTIVTIWGGDFLTVRRGTSGGQTVGVHGSNYNAVPNSLTVLSDDILTSLGLEFGAILHGMGAQGGGRNSGRFVLDETQTQLDVVVDGFAADMLVGYKTATDAPLLWLTDNAAPPGYQRPRIFAAYANEAELESTRGYAYYVRLR